MSEPEHSPAPSAYTVGAAFPHTHAADPGREATRRAAPATAAPTATPEVVPAPDQASPWSALSAGAPGVADLAAVEPVTMRVGWLNHGRPAPEPGPGGDAV